MDPEAVAAWRDVALVCLTLLPCLALVATMAGVVVGAKALRSVRLGLRPQLQAAASTADRLEAQTKRMSSVVLSPYFLAVRLGRTIAAWLGR